MDNKRISEIVDEEMIKQDANRYRDMRKILTIPKSIAEQADTMEFIELQRDGLGIFQQFFDYNQHEYMDVIFAYLNPLTRHLVKVVEND